MFQWPLSPIFSTSAGWINYVLISNSWEKLQSFKCVRDRTILCMNDCGLGVCEALCGHSIDQVLTFFMPEGFFMTRMPVNPKTSSIQMLNMFVFVQCSESVDYRYAHFCRASFWWCSQSWHLSKWVSIVLAPKVADWVKGPVTQMYGIHDTMYKMVHFHAHSNPHKPTRPKNTRPICVIRVRTQIDLYLESRTGWGPGIRCWDLRATPICIAIEKTSTTRLGWHPQGSNRASWLYQRRTIPVSFCASLFEVRKTMWQMIFQNSDYTFFICLWGFPSNITATLEPPELTQVVATTLQTPASKNTWACSLGEWFMLSRTDQRGGTN